MSLLFDVSPEEPARARKKVGRPFPEPEKQEISPPSIGKMPVLPARLLGKLDDVHACIDTACGASAHDIVEEEGRQWLIECCFCGTAQWVPVIAGHLRPRQDEFVFRDGRFAGFSISDAAAQPRGLDYVKWAAKSSPRPAVRSACERWLAQNAAGR